MKLEDFRPIASEEQIRVLDNIMKLGTEEKKYLDLYNERQREIDRKLSGIRYEHGLRSDLIRADLELFVDPLLPNRDRYLSNLEKIQAEMKILFRRAIEDLDMGHLGFIQRNYENVVGEPLPITHTDQ